MKRGRLYPLSILALALVAGGFLRFYRLDAFEMSADEGASWAAAAAPSLSAVLRAQVVLNPGKAGLHDLALHLWMRAFGDGLSAMRALSAVAGTLAVALVFLLTRETFAPPSGAEESAAPLPPEARNLTAALAALLFAVNLVMVKYAREARMYPLEIDAVIGAAYCVICGMNRGGWIWPALAAICAALAIAAHLTALAALGAIGLWLLYIFLRAQGGAKSAATSARRALGNLAALAAGAALLAPLAPAVIGSAAHAAAIGAIDWIKRPAWWAPFALFNKATGTFAFPVYAALAGWGAIRCWRQARDRVLFALIWMWAPPAVVLAASYILEPLFMERYLIAVFVPFFMLAALGIVAIESRPSRGLALGLALALALGHLWAWSRKAHDVQWREAAMAARYRCAAGEAIVVAPGYADNVVRYYLRGPKDGPRVIPVNKAAGSDARVAILGDAGVAPEIAARVRAEYPRAVARDRGVVVRER